MAATKVAVIYGASSKILRKIVIPDKDGDLAGFKLAADEAMRIIDRPSSDMFTAARAECRTVNGDVAPAEPRCAVVNEKGLVVSFLCADPGIKPPAGMFRLVAAGPGAVIGASWDGKKFTAPVPPDAEPPMAERR